MLIEGYDDLMRVLGKKFEGTERLIRILGRIALRNLRRSSSSKTGLLFFYSLGLRSEITSRLIKST